MTDIKIIVLVAILLKPRLSQQFFADHAHRQRAILFCSRSRRCTLTSTRRWGPVSVQPLYLALAKVQSMCQDVDSGAATTTSRLPCCSGGAHKPAANWSRFADITLRDSKFFEELLCLSLSA
jgi:hypothetical protein